MDRREFIQTLAISSATLGLAPFSAAEDALYELAPFGNARILHTCDVHAQLLPVHFREPNVNLGFGKGYNKPPHIVGDALLKHYDIAPDSRLAHALSYINFSELAQRYGAMGGMAYMATLTKRLRSEVAGNACIHLDSGDLWHGSYTALQSQGADMVQAANLLGIDAMTGHWEFTYPAEVLRKNIAASQGEFLAQNIHLKEEALFDGVEAYDEDSGLAFKPYTMREVGGRRIAIIGQAFPFTPISNPQRFIQDWTFGIQRQALQSLIDTIRKEEQPQAIILLSHNGADLDVTMAADLQGLDFILGGHTHDNLYQPRVVNNTVIVNTGCVGKFVGCLDIEFGSSGVRDYRWRMLPLFSNLLAADSAMQAHIDQVRAPYQQMLAEPLAQTKNELYRRGNFNGTMDQLILDALRETNNSDIALSPGFRWGTSLPAGATITMEDVYNATAITYPETYTRDMRGGDLKTILEEIADNLYHRDPYYQQGGDMVRTGGLKYTLLPAATLGKRIDNLRLSNDQLLQADKMYRVSGWATQTQSAGAPIWQVLADYLRAHKQVHPMLDGLPEISGVVGNPGIADYPSELMGK